MDLLESGIANQSKFLIDLRVALSVRAIWGGEWHSQS